MWLIVLGSLAGSALPASHAISQSPKGYDRDGPKGAGGFVNIALLGQASISYGTLGVSTQSTSPNMTLYGAGGSLRFTIQDRWILGVGAEFRQLEQFSVPTSETGNRRGSRLVLASPHVGFKWNSITFLAEGQVLGNHVLSGKNGSGEIVQYGAPLGVRWSGHYQLSNWFSLGITGEWMRFGQETVGSTTNTLSSPLTSWQFGAQLTLHLFDFGIGKGGGFSRASPVRMRR